MAQEGHPFGDLPYVSADDIILNLGRSYRAKGLPKGVGIGDPNSCYDNALHLVLEHPGRFTYVEGYATHETLPFPAFHAWVLDEDGLAVDNTPSWPNPLECAYFGVPMPKDVVFAAAIRNSSTGVFEGDWRSDFYFVREGWRDCV